MATTNPKVNEGEAAGKVTYIPAAALKRFADDLISEGPSNRFLQINKDRVHSFVDKSLHAPQNSHSPSRSSYDQPQRKLKIPGINQYSFPTDGTTTFMHLQSLPEFQSQLGARSRFGEGDGSFFDRWLNADVVASKQILDKDGLPIMKFSLTEVNTGFKRHIKDYKDGKDVSKGRSQVFQSYTERRAERLEREKSLEKKPSQLEKPSDPSVEVKGGSPPRKQELKLPSLTKKLTAVERENYFGEGARVNFFDYYHHLSRRRVNEDLYAATNSAVPNVVYNNGKETGAVISRPTTSDIAWPKKEAPKKKSQKLAMEDDLDGSLAHDVALAGSAIEAVISDDWVNATRDTYSRLRPRDAPVSEEEKHLLLDHLMSIDQLETRDKRPSSARTKFLKGCVVRNLLPQPSMIIRRNLSTILSINSMGVGDEMMETLAGSFELLPALDGILLADNKLTDLSLVPVIQGLADCKDLKTLDISNNKLGKDGIEELTRFFRSSSCPLTELVLNKCSLDDASLSRLALAFLASGSLEQLDLSYNKLGSFDSSVSRKNETSGCEALARLLKQSGCRLKKLVLSWNTIRSSSGAHLAAAVQHNCSLTHLDLSNNCLGVEGGEALGGALHFNRNLQVLKVAHNNLTTRPALTIMSGAKACESLRSLDLSENPIGQQGIKSVLFSSLFHTRKIQVDVRNCAVKSSDAERVFFDFEQPASEYSLKLTNPFEYAVAAELLRILSVDESLVCSNCKLVSADESSSSDIQLKLFKRTPSVRQALTAMSARESSAKLLEAYTLQNTDGSYDAVKELVKETALLFLDEQDDESQDNSSVRVIPAGSALSILDSLGFDNPKAMFSKLLTIYDSEGLGNIEEDELIDSLLYFKKKMELFCIQSATVQYVYQDTGALQASSSASASAEPKPFALPETGTLHLSITKQSAMLSAGKSTITSEQLESVLEITQNLEDLSGLFSTLSRWFKWDFDVAKRIYATMVKDFGSPRLALARSLPCMVNPLEAKLLIQLATKGDFYQIQNLKIALGPLYRVYTGIPNGYYALNLRNKQHREILECLYNISHSEMIERQSLKLGDCSQSGTGLGFRSASLDGAAVRLDQQWFQAVPSKGLLSFDFVSFSAPSSEHRAVSNERFCRILRCLGVLKASQVSDSLGFLAEESSNKAAGRRFLWSSSFAKDVSTQLDLMHDTFSTGSRATRRYSVDLDSQLHLTETAPSPRSPRTADAAAMRPDTTDSQKSQQLIERAPREQSAKEKGKASDEKGAASDENSFQSEDDDEDISDCSLYGMQLNQMLKANYLEQEALALQFLDAMEEIFATRFITSAQLAIAVQKHPFGQLSLRDGDGFSTYRVELIVSLFSRLIDVTNFELVVRDLEPPELAMVIFRLGWLSVWNPLRPEGAIALNLARLEERTVAHMIVKLSESEGPGAWINATFQPNVQSDALNDWQYPPEWVSDGPAHEGVLTLQYFPSRGSKQASACKASVPTRLALMTNVLAVSMISIAKK